MGTELERRGVPMHSETWAGAALIEHPEAVVDVHADFIRAGAEVIITNTFGASPLMLEAMGYGERAEAIIRGSVDLARRARDRVGRDVAIAGSISTMAPGGDLSRPGNLQSDDEIADSLGRMARALADGGCDLIALEMMRDARCAPIAMHSARETGLPVWLGLACTREKDSGDLVAFDVPENRFVDTLAATLPLEPDLVWTHKSASTAPQRLKHPTVISLITAHIQHLTRQRKRIKRRADTTRCRSDVVGLLHSGN